MTTAGARGAWSGHLLHHEGEGCWVSWLFVGGWRSCFDRVRVAFRRWKYWLVVGVEGEGPFGSLSEAVHVILLPLGCGDDEASCGRWCGSRSDGYGESECIIRLSVV